MLLPKDLLQSLIGVGVQVRDIIEDVSMEAMSVRKLTKTTIDQIEGLKGNIVDEDSLSLKKKSDMEGDDWS